MNKKSLSFMCVLGLIVPAIAQESLFPEFSEEIQVVGEGKKSEDSSLELNKEPQKEQSQAVVSSQTDAKEIEKNSDEEEEEEDKEEKIYIALNNIKATLTEVSSVSHCSADFVLLNNFKKKTLNNFSVILTIGNKEKKFDFKNVKPLASIGKGFIMVGPDCASLTKTPARNIQKCQLQGVSEKKCKEKVEYISLQQTAK